MGSIVATFLRGLTVVVPVAFTLWLIVWLANGAEALLRSAFLLVLPERMYMPGLGVLSGIVLVFAVGILLQIFFVERFWTRFEHLLERIPLVKTIYNATRDFFGVFSSNMATGDSTVVVVDIGSDAQMIGFIIGTPSRALVELGGDLVAVYLPMSYQLGGYTVLIPRERVRVLDWSMEEAMRFVLTAGINRPTGAPPS